jgi:hypothetical protein
MSQDEVMDGFWVQFQVVKAKRLGGPLWHPIFLSLETSRRIHFTTGVRIVVN